MLKSNIQENGFGKDYAAKKPDIFRQQKMRKNISVFEHKRLSQPTYTKWQDTETRTTETQKYWNTN